MSDTPQATILVIDDTPANIQVVMELLSAEGFRVLVAEDGEDGLESARAGRPDLILLDMTGEEIAGPEALEQLRSESDLGDAPIIALESGDGDASIVFSSSLEGYECSAGPVDMDGLVHCVEEMLEKA